MNPAALDGFAEWKDRCDEYFSGYDRQGIQMPKAQEAAPHGHKRYEGTGQVPGVRGKA